jgi:hypothetical protein
MGQRSHCNKRHSQKELAYSDNLLLNGCAPGGCDETSCGGGYLGRPVPLRRTQQTKSLLDRGRDQVSAQPPSQGNCTQRSRLLLSPIARVLRALCAVVSASALWLPFQASAAPNDACTGAVALIFGQVYTTTTSAATSSGDQGLTKSGRAQSELTSFREPGPCRCMKLARATGRTKGNGIRAVLESAGAREGCALVSPTSSFGRCISSKCRFSKGPPCENTSRF